MKILLVMDPGIPVPPKGYGGIERIVALLAKGYLDSGHEVDILASRGSAVAGCTMHIIGEDGFPPLKKTMNKAIITAWKFLHKHRNRYDLVHNFGRLLYLLPILNHPVKKLMCYQREITTRNIMLFNKLPNKHMLYCGCSRNLVNRAGAPGKWTVVHNTVDFSQFSVNKDIPADAPLIFLGRIERIKGCHTAIRVAKATGHKLLIAGNISALPEEIQYFENEISPLIDGQQIIYAGEVNDVQKNEWLGKARALLMPIEWEEPFGIVMIEAMACGTPVIGYQRGAIPEVIEEGTTGFVVNSEAELIQKCLLLDRFDREKCRNTALARFDLPEIARQYLNLI